MNKINFFPVYLKKNFNEDSFYSLILDNLEVNISYCLRVRFIYYESALDGINLDKPILFIISESNSIKSINRLYFFLLNKAGHYNNYKSSQAEILVIYYEILS